jgi:hypothetical protein
MPIGSVAVAVPPQITAALAAIANTQTAEIAVAAELEQGSSGSANLNLGQIVNLTV